MATTFEDLVNDLDTFLMSFGSSRPKVSYLQAPMSTTDKTLVVAHPDAIDRGFIEVDDELMWVDSIDKGTQEVTLMPWGRAQLSSSLASHDYGARITCNPRFPRARLKQAINDEINGLYPDLYGIQIDESNTYRPAVITYPLPAAVESVISVSYQRIGPSKRWEPVSRYRFDTSADPTLFPTGNSIDIIQGVQVGRKLKIVYRTRPQIFTQYQGLDHITDHGIDEGWRDILQMGAAAQCILSLDSARLDLETIESANRAAVVQPLMAAQVAKNLIANQQVRVQQERRRLNTLNPTSQVRYT